MKRSTLTTVIPVYNGESYLGATLQSVAMQTRRPDRLVVLDDGSTDATARIAQGFKALECEYVRNESNLGLFPNHNRALEYAAETDYLHILHANDLIKPEFYRQILAGLELCPGLGMAFSGYELIDENGSTLGTMRGGPSGPIRILSRRQLLQSQAELKPLLIDAVVLKTDRTPPPCWFPTDFPQLGDVVFHARWASHCVGIYESREAMCQFRQHPHSATSRNVASLEAWVLDEWRAMALIADLIEDSPFGRWLRRQKLRSLYAARSHVKMQTLKSSRPELASAIRTASRQICGPWHWRLGAAAVLLRDLLFRLLGVRAVKPGQP
jgi:glycosyltransferase involved in cell wall biosynthesis